MRFGYSADFMQLVLYESSLPFMRSARVSLLRQVLYWDIGEIVQ